MKKPLPLVTVRLDRIVGGGQTIGTMDDGRKLFVWGGLPGELVEVQLTKKKSSLAEGTVTSVIEASDERIDPIDPDSYLSTSPWQIMSLATEQHYKSALVEEAFELHDIVLPGPITMYTDGTDHGYRNKVEFSWYWNNDSDQLDLAFFRRGTHGKIAVDGTSLAVDVINVAARQVRDMLRDKQVEGRNLKTLLIRADRDRNVSAQLYVKNKTAVMMTDDDFARLGLADLEIIYSNPKSPASVITERLDRWGTMTLQDTILDMPFRYAVESFFQINLPVYEQALRDMSEWIAADKPTVDLYSGVGSIGLTIGRNDVTMVEINESAVREMRANIDSLGKQATVTAVLASSETALEHIVPGATIIVDPPRAGLHVDVTQTLLDTRPARIIYLSCNPVTQARDVARLASAYGIRHHRAYNFFPKTPHIEHLVVLDLKA